MSASGHCVHCTTLGRWCKPQAPDWWHGNDHVKWADRHCPTCGAATAVEDHEAKLRAVLPNKGWFGATFRAGMSLAARMVRGGGSVEALSPGRSSPERLPGD